MGKFYLENKHKWFQHQTELEHQRQLAEKNLFSGTAVQEIEELRFVCDTPDFTPTHVRIVDFNEERLAVEAGHQVIGHLDEESTVAMRAYLRRYRDLEDECPAVVVEFEAWSGCHVLKLGYKK